MHSADIAYDIMRQRVKDLQRQAAADRRAARAAKRSRRVERT